MQSPNFAISSENQVVRRIGFGLNLTVNSSVAAAGQEGNIVQLLEAKTFIGKLCSIRWRERSGAEQHTVSRVHDAAFVPLYGGYLITDRDEIRLDRVVSVSLVAETPQTVPVEDYRFVMKMAA
jgi:hypothetical protein